MIGPTATGPTVEAVAATTREIAAVALETERLGRLPDETVRRLMGLGITRLVMPRRWSGLELGFASVIEIVAALAGGCMSVAWCAALYAEHPWVLAHFDERAQADVWSGDDGPDVPLSMSVAALGTATRVAGGVNLNGTWPFVSGCDHAPWLLLAAEWDSTSESEAGRGLCLVPRTDLSIDHASWRVAGLRGTGSKTVSVRDAFVPGHRVRDVRRLIDAGSSGSSGASALFCQPFAGTLGLALAAVAVGGAEAAVEQFGQRLSRRLLAHQQRTQATDPAAQMELGGALLNASSARLLLEHACAQVRQAGERSEQFSGLAFAELRARKAHVVRLSSDAIDAVFGASGGGALQETQPLQRAWRDVHAIQAHASMNWKSHVQNYGSIAVGLGPTLRGPW